MLLCDNALMTQTGQLDYLRVISMSNKFIVNSRNYSIATLLLVLLCTTNSVHASLIEYKVSLWGPGMQAHGPEVCDNLNSYGTIVGEYDDGVLSNITGQLSFITITAGYIASGLNQVENFVRGIFNDSAPEFFQGKEVFIDMSRGASYEPAVVTETTIREWAWALFLTDEGEDWRTIRRQDKTLAQLCRHGEKWCKAGVEFFGDHGKRIPDTPIPLPAAFYLFLAGFAGLLGFGRIQKSV